MKKIIVLIILVIIIVLAILGLTNKEKPLPLNSETDGLVLDSPTDGRAALLPIFVTGKIKKDGTWGMSDGKAGEVRLYDSKGRAVSDSFDLMIVSETTSEATFRAFVKSNKDIKTEAGYLVLNDFTTGEAKIRRVDINLAQGIQFIPIGEPFSIPEAVIMPVEGVDKLGITFLGAAVKEGGLTPRGGLTESKVHLGFSIIDADTLANEDGSIIGTTVGIVEGETKIIETAAGTISIYAIYANDGAAAIELNIVK